VRIALEFIELANDLCGLQPFSLVNRDKLEAGNVEQRMRRQQGNQDSLFRKVCFN